jgi:uncharacterized protein YcfL
MNTWRSSFLSLLALGACAIATPARAQAEVQPEEPARLETVFETRSLDHRIELGPPRFRAVGNLTQLQIQVRNASSRQQLIEYRIEWFDAEGFSVQAGTVWQPLILTPNATSTINSVGQVAKAHAARLTLRDTEHTR